MAEEEKKYVVYGMRAKCSQGSMENYISTDVGHGVVYQGNPLLNANDHTPQVNLTHFGDCHSKLIYEEAKKQADEKYKADADDGFFAKAGKFIAKNVTKAALTAKEYLGANKCELDTPLPWMFANSEHMIDGAPALTMESQCACRFGGVISIVPVEDEAEEAIEEVKHEEDEEETAFIQMMQENYGFSGEQAELISKAYNLFMSDEKNQNLSREEQLHEFFANMAGLCINYSGEATRWKLVCDTPSTLDAMGYFNQLGLSEEEVFDLMGVINFQHTEGELLSRASDYNSQGFCSNADCNRECGYKYHITDSKYWGFDYGDAANNKDFAHEVIQYACFSNDNLFHNVWDALEPMMGNLNSLTSYKGDVYSTRMNVDDMNSDMDAINMYNLFIKHENEDIFEIMTNYNTGVASGEINRAAEFLSVLGGGDAEKGYESLEKELNQAEYGAIYIDRGIEGIVQDILFTGGVSSSGAAILGEDTLENVMEYSTGKQVENDEEISEARQKFLAYVYEEWKKDE